MNEQHYTIFTKSCSSSCKILEILEILLMSSTMKSPQFPVPLGHATRKTKASWRFCEG